MAKFTEKTFWKTRNFEKKYIFFSLFFLLYAKLTALKVIFGGLFFTIFKLGADDKLKTFGVIFNCV